MNSLLFETLGPIVSIFFGIFFPANNVAPDYLNERRVVYVHMRLRRYPGHLKSAVIQVNGIYYIYISRKIYLDDFMLNNHKNS